MLCFVVSCQENRVDISNQKNINIKIDTIKPPNEIWRDKMKENLVHQINDTFLINLDSINRIDSIGNLKFENYEYPEILNFLRENSFKRNELLCLIDSKKISYRLWEDLIDIPLPIYQKIFPSDEEYLKVERENIRKGSRVSRGDRLVKMEYGEKIVVTKKYSKIYCINEFENYVQLILLSEGKYFPKAFLVNLSKVELKYIDDILIFDSFVDAGEIEIKLGCFDVESSKLKIWDIHNSKTKSNWELVDTIQINYEISSKGKISKISEHLIVNEK